MSGCSISGCICSLDDSVITLLAFPSLWVGELLDCGVYGVSELRSCSLGCPSWFVLLFMSVCPSPALGLWWFGHRSVAPPAAPGCWALLESRLRRSDALASGRTPSFSFLAGDFFLGRLLGLWLVGCDPAWVPTFFWGTSPSLVRGFRWAVPAVWLSRLLVFSWNLYLGSFLSLPVFAAGLRWFRLILGCPPSVAWR